MSVQTWAENIVLVNLAKEPEMGEELEATAEAVTDETGLSVVVDFADVDIVTSSSLAKLLRIRKALHEGRGRLVLSSVKPQTMKIFEVAGLDTVFEFVSDQYLALASVQMVAAE